jgi:hypothetical protein
MALEALIPLKARTGIVALTFAGGTNATHAGWRCSVPVRLSLTLVILIVCTTWYARAQSVPPASSFAGSCKNIRVTRDTLYADCYRADGSTLNSSSILIKGIRNVEGDLKFFSMDEPSSFQNSCGQINVGSGGNTLEAWCNQSGGAANKTSILIPGIANNNGVLVYSSPPTPIRTCSAEQANRCRSDRDTCLGMIIESRRQICHDGYRQCLSEC